MSTGETVSLVDDSKYKSPFYAFELFQAKYTPATQKIFRILVIVIAVIVVLMIINHVFNKMPTSVVKIEKPQLDTSELAVYDRDSIYDDEN